MKSSLLVAAPLPLAALLAWGCGGVEQTPTSATTTGTSGTTTGTGAGGAGGEAPSYCDGKTTLIADPMSGQAPFPDDAFTVDDPSAVTGLRVHVVPGENFPAPATGPTFKTVFADLSTLDGFGTTAGLTLTFTGPLDPLSLPAGGAGSGKADASVVLVDLDAPKAVFLDVEWELVAEKDGDPTTTLALRALSPLKPKTRYGLAVTTKARAMDGCIAPPESLRALLDEKPNQAQARLAGRIGDLVKRLEEAGTIADRHELSAAVVFTTQHTTEDSAGIAAKIRTKKVAYASSGPCSDSGKGYLICEGVFSADDFRVDARAVDETKLSPQGSYLLPVTTYLPTAGKAPFPTVIYGHGLAGDRHQGEQLAELAAPQGYATIAVDAVSHGEHPDKPGGLGAAASFFGLSLDLNDPLDSLKLRDHFRQSTYDKLQLLEMLRPGVDIDGDQQIDVGIDKLAYLGVSLGGIMSAEFLAFAPEVKVALPIVPGARVVDIIKDGKTFAPVIGFLKGKSTIGQIARFFPVVQTVVDRGDAGAYTPHIVANRIGGFDQQRPQVLMQMVIDDDTVPNSTNLFFARGLGLPHVGEALLPIGIIPHQINLPVSGNVDATHTGGVFQFDVVFEGNGPMTKTATHGNVAGNPVAIAQTLHFIETALAGAGEIIDPYKTLGIKP